ncbi:MAG: histidine--tRNA ligase [Chitinophagales bacterium]|nr:MAG: histidine--tRNA ligase [Chitinophagales bacterium]
MKIKPALPKGTRDFGPEELRKRNYIFGIIRNVFEKYGFQPIETPAMENLSTLEGKYGEEGDKLLFRILNNGDFLKEVREQKIELREENLKQVTSLIAEKGLRYDLTIPFARYVVQHQHAITFPFKRYQIQPVWRADRPQKGRYREFYQCDADVIGSTSLLNEAELIFLYEEVFTKLGLDVKIQFNNRKLLVALAEKNGICDKLMAFTTALDKLDKVGEEKVKEELTSAGINTKALEVILAMKSLSSDEKIAYLEKYFPKEEYSRSGMNEIQYILKQASACKKLEFAPALARGLDYYTGTIFEVKPTQVQMGSLGGGGRYDNLTGVFGLPGVSGVGISFGVERIYDVMQELQLFERINLPAGSVRAMFINFGGEAEKQAFQYLQQLRARDIASEIYPSAEKIKKQIAYADKKGIAYVIFAGEEELKSGQLQVKELKSGTQHSCTPEELITLLTADSQ